MCRFNPHVARDEGNYDIVEGNIVELCEEAVRLLGEKTHPAIGLSPETISKLIATMPSVPQEALPGLSLSSSHRQDHENLVRWVQRLGDSGSG